MQTSRNQILHSPPSRVWESTPGGWASRPWKISELRTYIREVLHRAPTELDYRHCKIEKDLPNFS